MLRSTAELFDSCARLSFTRATWDLQRDLDVVYVSAMSVQYCDRRQLSLCLFLPKGSKVRPGYLVALFNALAHLHKRRADAEGIDICRRG